MKFIKH